MTLPHLHPVSESRAHLLLLSGKECKESKSKEPQESRGWINERIWREYNDFFWRRTAFEISNALRQENYDIFMKYALWNSFLWKWELSIECFLQMVTWYLLISRTRRKLSLSFPTPMFLLWIKLQDLLSISFFTARFTYLTEKSMKNLRNKG